MLKNIKNFVINPYIFLTAVITSLWAIIFDKLTLEGWNLPLLNYFGGTVCLL